MIIITPRNPEDLIQEKKIKYYFKSKYISIIYVTKIFFRDYYVISSEDEEKIEKFSDVEEAENYVLKRLIEGSYFDFDVVNFFINSSYPAEYFKKYYDYILQSDFKNDDIKTSIMKIFIVLSIMNRIKKSKKYKFSSEELINKLIYNTNFVQTLTKRELLNKINIENVSEEFLLEIIQQSIKLIISENDSDLKRIRAIDNFIDNFVQFLFQNGFSIKKERVIKILSKLFESYKENFLIQIFPEVMNLKKNGNLHSYFWDCFYLFSVGGIMDSVENLLKSKASKLYEIVYVMDYKSKKYYKRDKTQYFTEQFSFKGKDKKTSKVNLSNKGTSFLINSEGIEIDGKFEKYEDLKMESEKIKLSQEGININLKNETKKNALRKINKDDMVFFIKCSVGSLSFLELTEKNSVYFYLLMMKKLYSENKNKNLPEMKNKSKELPKKEPIELKPKSRTTLKNEFYSAPSKKLENKEIAKNPDPAVLKKEDPKEEENRINIPFEEDKKSKSKEKTKYFLEFLNRYKNLKKDQKETAKIIFSINPMEEKSLEELEINALDVVNLIPKFTIYLIPFIEMNGEKQKNIVWGKRLEPQTVEEIQDYIEKNK